MSELDCAGLERCEAPWCGTAGGYTNHWCRCRACTFAHAAAVRRWTTQHRDHINAYQRAYKASRRKRTDEVLVANTT